MRDQRAGPLCRRDETPVGKVGVVRCGVVPAMPEERTDERQTFARHDRLTRGDVPQIGQSGLVADAMPLILDVVD